MRTSTKIVAVVGGTALALSTAGVAFAYWTTSGSNTGSATSASGAANLTVTQGTVPTGLAPSVAPVAVPGTIKNNAASSAYVTKLVVTITGVTGDGSIVGSPACTAADYGLTATGTTALSKDSTTVQTLDLSIAQELAPTAQINFPAFKIGFANDAAANQDNCKGASPTLSFVAS